MKKVLVSQRVDHIEDRSETRDALDQKFVSLLYRLEIVAVPIPNFFGISKKHFYNFISSLEIDGIILSGGASVGLYPERDATDERLISYGIDLALPILGICRGMQSIGLYFGGSLQTVPNHVCVRHKLRSVSTSFPYPDTVNSFHDFSLMECPKDFDICAFSEDGCIEAIAHKRLPIEGWMWHPERELESSKVDTDNIARIFS